MVPDTSRKGIHCGAEGRFLIGRFALPCGPMYAKREPEGKITVTTHEPEDDVMNDHKVS